MATIQTLVCVFSIMACFTCNGDPLISTEMKENSPKRHNPKIKNIGLMPNENGDYIIDDMVLTEDQIIRYFGLASKRSRIQAGSRSGNPFESARWPDGTLPYQFDDKYAFSYKEKKTIWDMIDKFNLDMDGCLKIVKRKDEQDYVSVKKSDQGCRSAVGKARGKQNILLANYCVLDNGKPDGSILHEFIHAWGFSHEHERHDRNDYVQVLKENINDTKWYNFKMNEDSKTFDVPYDYGSIMHYSSSDFRNKSISKNKNTIESKTGFPTSKLGQRKGMSDCDKLKLRKMYKCSIEEFTEKCEDFKPKTQFCKNCKRKGICNWKTGCKTHCKKTCNFCNECKDNYGVRKCKNFKYEGKCCEKNVMKNCKKTCNLCGPKPRS